jgi:MarR family 2-MHQ and catechol resistance regulon transcriptional repressor
MSPGVDDRESRTGSASGPADGGRDRDATLQLMIALGRAYRALERGGRPQLAERGLGLSEFAVLEVLYHKGPLTLGEIRDRILVTGASTTYVVKKLEERGLVRRVAGAEDQRTVIAELTQEGRALIADVFPDHVEQLRQLMSGLSVADKHAAAALLRTLATGASAHQ